VSSIVPQLLNGMASASALFLVAAGLSLIFGVTRIINFAHGSLYMLGLYVACSAVKFLSPDAGTTVMAFWGGVLLSAVVVAAVGGCIEFLLLRRLYHRPELLQLLATFGVVLVIRDATLWLWGPEDILGPRAPGLHGALEMAGQPFPQYDLVLMLVGPMVLATLWFILNRTRWGALVRASTEDRDMAGALGIDQARLFTSVFMLGSLLAGLGGALQMPREPAQLGMDLTTIADAFVVVVVGGLGSIPGAFLAALLIGEVKSLCIAVGDVSILGIGVSMSRMTLAVEFLVMAIVLVIRPSGLLGQIRTVVAYGGNRTAVADRTATAVTRPVLIAFMVVAIAVFAAPLLTSGYTLVLLIDIFVFALFAASLQFLVGTSGLTSFGHAAYFGLGAYGAALLLKSAGVSMEAALLVGPLAAMAGAMLFGWFCIRLEGIYFAMLTLAFAQIVWSVIFQWEGLTGGSNGLIGIWPAEWMAGRTAFYYVALVLCGLGIAAVYRLAQSPFGFALRAARDSALRSEAIGLHGPLLQWSAFVLAGSLAGLAGAVHAFSKGSISPEVLGISRSVDGLMMVLLGGLDSVAGPVIGAALFTWLQDVLTRNTEYWRAVMGGIIIVLVLVLPNGIFRMAERERRFRAKAA
jgi:branched-chain amino acid transport system permease protein